MKEYIEREAAENAIRNDLPLSTWMKRSVDKAAHAMGVTVDAIEAIPAADVVPWKWLEQYADYFCAGVSMPEFVREAKMFYESSNKAMQGGVIGG